MAFFLIKSVKNDGISLLPAVKVLKELKELLHLADRNNGKDYKLLQEANSALRSRRCSLFPVSCV